jgi:hypothetical protein
VRSGRAAGVTTALFAFSGGAAILRPWRGPRPSSTPPPQDWLHLILAPVWALALGLLIGLTPLARWKVAAFGLAASPADAFLGAFIMAHLVLVFWRSHADPAVRARHPVRFFVVPPLLLTALLLSGRARAGAAALAIWWDAYHSALQTFGIARLYDMKAGNDPEAGRSLDFALNLLLYLGPILGGAMLLFHSSALFDLETAGAAGAGAWVGRLSAAQPWLRSVLIGGGVAFLACYLLAYDRLARRGCRPPREKVVLHLGTAAVSIWAWGFNPLGMALFIMNFFHAWQYFALVWRYERERVRELLPARARPAAFALFVLSAFAYGAVFGVLGELSESALAVTLVVSLLHFWYDGFVWSVRAGQV